MISLCDETKLSDPILQEADSALCQTNRHFNLCGKEQFVFTFELVGVKKYFRYTKFLRHAYFYSIAIKENCRPPRRQVEINITT